MRPVFSWFNLGYLSMGSQLRQIKAKFGNYMSIVDLRTQALQQNNRDQDLRSDVQHSAHWQKTKTNTCCI